MRGSLKSWSGLVLVTALGACSNIIGVSEIEIDPSLDGASGSSKGGTSAGGKGSGGDSVVPQAGEESGGNAGTSSGGALSGGSSNGGSSNGGSSNGGSSNGGSAGVSGEAGMGGEPPVDPEECDTDCDDDIACTVDTCENGECVHTTDDTLCQASACETCRAGIGCVAGTKTTKDLLVDGGFDDGAGDWEDASPANIIADPSALSAPNSLKIGPAAANATAYLYADVYQWVTVPEGTVGLKLDVSYQFAPGAKNLDEEYTVIALYLDGDVDPFTQFNEFEGGDPAQTTWKTVSFSAPASEVALMGGLDFSLDFVGHSFDGVYKFENVKLSATVCE